MNVLVLKLKLVFSLNNKTERTKTKEVKAAKLFDLNNPYATKTINVTSNNVNFLLLR